MTGQGNGCDRGRRDGPNLPGAIVFSRIRQDQFRVAIVLQCD